MLWYTSRAALQAPVLAAAASPAGLACQAVDDVRGFAVEKYGIPPDMYVSAPAATAAAGVTCAPPLVLYSLAEVLKNAVTALEAQHGAWDLDEALPITVTVRLPEPPAAAAVTAHAVPASAGADFFWSGGASASGGRGMEAHCHATASGGAGGRECREGGVWEIEVVDYAGGIPEEAEADIGRFFFSTVRASPAAGYGYSKDHGAVFSGHGVGIPMAQMYAEMMGGGLTVVRHEDGAGRGTRATLRLPVDGFAFQC